jgi:acyl carrier protein
MAKPSKKKSKPKKAASDDIVSRIRRIVAGQLKKKPDQITLNAGLQTDLQGDSLDALEIIFQLEEEFNIKIDEAEAQKIVTVQDIVTYVTKKVKN